MYFSIKEFKKDPDKYTFGEIEYILSHQHLTEKFLREYDKYWKGHWNAITSHQRLNENFIRDYADKINWKILCQWPIKVEFSEQFMLEFKHKLYWDYLSRYQRFSKEFITKHSSLLNINELMRNARLYDDISNQEFFSEFLRSNKKGYDWNNPGVAGLDINFIREHKNEITTWNSVVRYHINDIKFHEEFYRYYNKDDWYTISREMRNVPFNFIKKHEENWNFGWMLFGNVKEEDKNEALNLWREKHNLGLA